MLFLQWQVKCLLWKGPVSIYFLPFPQYRVVPDENMFQCFEHHKQFHIHYIGLVAQASAVISLTTSTNKTKTNCMAVYHNEGTARADIFLWFGLTDFKSPLSKS